ERAIAAEMIREKLIVVTEEEMPYSTAVMIDRFEEGDRLHRIFASIFVERDSQKAIVIGKGGQKLREIGTEARKALEAFFGRKIFLELHVKVKKNWRDDEETSRTLGLGEGGEPRASARLTTCCRGFPQTRLPPNRCERRRCRAPFARLTIRMDRRPPPRSNWNR